LLFCIVGNIFTSKWPHNTPRRLYKYDLLKFLSHIYIIFLIFLLSATPMYSQLIQLPINRRLKRQKIHPPVDENVLVIAAVNLYGAESTLFT